MAERRTQKRYLAMVPLLLSVNGGLYQKPVRLRSRDISEGGLSFETRSEIPLEASGQVHVSTLGDLPRDARIEAHVVYRKPGDTPRRYVVGLEFDRFIGVTKEQLVERLEPWERQSTEKRAAADRIGRM